MHIIRRRKRRRETQRQARQRTRTWFLVAIAGFALLVVGPSGVLLGGVASAYARALNMLPTPQETITLDPITGPTRIYDSTGQTLLYTIEDPLGDSRAWIPLDQLPPFVAQATLLVEDSDFLTSTRFNPIITLGRLWNNLLDGPLEAESSLTGRLVRNVIVPARDYVSVDERALEIALVAEINRQYSPQEVLEWHLNTNYYGNRAYGIEAAAQIYLGKSARDLTLDEAALLTAIPTAPQYNPVDNPTAALSRQSDVLRRLLAAGYITQNQFLEASNITTAILPNAGQTPLIAPEFTVYARGQAEQILNSLGRDGAQMVARGDLRIITTLDLDLYYQTECGLRAHLQRLARGDPSGLRTLAGDACIMLDFLPALLASSASSSAPPDNGVVVMLDVQTGEIRSMVGPAARIQYQPGPVLQPFVYLDALTNQGQRGSELYTAASMVLDIPRQFPGAQDGLLYQPGNPDGAFRGPMNLRDAMAMNLLPPVAQIAHVRPGGLNGVLRRTANLMGINSLNEGIYNLSLLERGGAVSVLDVTYAYSVFASLGIQQGLVIDPLPGLRSRDPVAVRRIEDADGNILWEYDADYQAVSRAPFLQSELAYVVNDVLSDNAARRALLGPDNVLEMTRPAAAVNGITSDRVDNWTVGYTPQMVIGVRLGRADGAVSLPEFAVEGAAALWRGLVEYAHLRDGLPPNDWERPQFIITAAVCEVSGMLSNGVCPLRNEIFLDGTQPDRADTYWQSVEINSQTGQRATANTNTALRRAEVFFIPPVDAMDWWRANRRRLPPEEYDTVSRPDILSSAIILQPTAYSAVRGLVDIRGSMDTTNMQYYRVVYGEGVNPGQWIDITGQQTSYTAGTSLGVWDTSGLDGLYNLQLQVVLNDNTLEVSAPVWVTVDNIPPTIILRAGEPDQVFRWPQDTIIPLRAEVRDDLRIDRVVFYHNGQEVGVRTDCHIAPENCGFDWQITRTGTEIFTADVYDSVGNRSSAEIRVDVVRSGG